VAAGVFSAGVNSPDCRYGGWMGTWSSVTEGERLAMALALENEEADLVALASDSAAAIQWVVNLSKGHQLSREPISHIRP